MGMLYRLIIVVLGSLLLLYALPFEWKTSPPASTEQVVGWKEAVEYAQEHLPQQGVLTRKSGGFVYLKVDDAYIRKLFPMLDLKGEGFREPPYFRSPNAPGAHISVFLANEHIRPKEIGQTFHFKLKRITVIKTRNARFAILQVESPELENLRREYGLSPKLYGHHFHITLAKKTTGR